MALVKRINQRLLLRKLQKQQRESQRQRNRKRKKQPEQQLKFLRPRVP